MKYIIIIAIILACGWYLTFSRLVNAKKEITTLESEKTALTINIERYKNAEMEANKTISSLRKSANSSKESLDWYNTPVPNNVLIRMQERHNRNRAN
jgi:hypothetical protein